jgi:hypothetical protein
MASSIASLKDIAQQNIKTCLANFSLRAGVIVMAVIGLVLLLFGILFIVFSNDIIEIRERYDDVGACDDTSWNR